MDEPALIVGCGDLGIELARLLGNRNIRVVALTRSASNAGEIDQLNGTSRLLDLDELPAPLHEFARVYWFAPPPPTGAIDPRLARSLEALAGRGVRTRLVYVSTSGVYGDCQGRWIDEDEPCIPLSDRGRRRLHAETLLDDQARQHPAHFSPVILRVPGIYGPGKLPIQRLKQGLPIVREDQSPYTNRIQITDLARAAQAAMHLGKPGRRYNVSDGNPTTMADYFKRCAALLGMKAPKSISLEDAQRELTPAMRSFLQESKRLVTQRMRNELGITPLYPDLESGLRACISSF